MTIERDDAPSITCDQCGKTSYNINDVRERYCGHCHVFHDDLAWMRAHSDRTPQPHNLKKILATSLVLCTSAFVVGILYLFTVKKLYGR